MVGASTTVAPTLVPLIVVVTGTALPLLTTPILLFSCEGAADVVVPVTPEDGCAPVTDEAAIDDLVL